MTLGECLQKTYQLINYYSVAGTVLDRTNMTLEDYAQRAYGYIDTAQKELAADFPLYDSVTYTQSSLRPLAQHGALLFLDGNCKLEALGGNAWSMLCDGNVTVKLEAYETGAWVEKSVKTITGNGKLVAANGNSTQTIDADMLTRLTVTGSRVYIASLGLYAAFPTGEEIPVLGMRRFHTLPENFGTAQRITIRDRSWRGDEFYQIQNGRIGFPWDFTGAVNVSYTIWPRTVDASTLPDAGLEVSREAVELLPYYAAALLLLDEDPKLGALLLAQYQEKRERIRPTIGIRIRNSLYGIRRHI